MPEIIPASDLSDSERCFLLVQLKRRMEPDRFPIRDGAKRHFSQAIYRFAMEKTNTVAQDFEDEAAGRGFEYPWKYEHGNGMPPFYHLAKDYAMWLDGAIRIIQEFWPELTPTNPRNVAGRMMNPEGYCDPDGGLHFFRAVSQFDEYHIRWPEIIALGTEKIKEATVHRFRLPHSARGRLLSPLCMCYRHPMIKENLRLARREEEKFRGFTTNWGKVGRWELEDVSWEEWREGINRDRCMHLICDEAVVSHQQVPYQALRDAGKLVTFAEETKVPKKHETCSGCTFNHWCHGTSDQRRNFHRKESSDKPPDPVAAASDTMGRDLHT